VLHGAVLRLQYERLVMQHTFSISVFDYNPEQLGKVMDTGVELKVRSDSQADLEQTPGDG
jgi:hypothetical protein